MPARATRDEAGQRSEPDTEQNLVTLSGRVTSGPVERILPSGDRIHTFRVAVRRGSTPMSRGSSQSTDWVDCCVWGGRPRRAVATWRTGDLVRIEGALRRRFFRSREQRSSRLEVEVLGARMVRRGAC